MSAPPRSSGPAGGRTAFAHDAVLRLDAGGDERAPGGALTVALCGSWEHPPPCPLAPHHTAAERSEDVVRLRLLFATAREDEAWVRRVVSDVLARGWAEGPDVVRTTWTLVAAGPSTVRPEEEEHAARLSAS